MPMFYSDKGFFKAINKGKVEQVEAYLKKWSLDGSASQKPDPNPLDDMRDASGRNPLHAAAATGNISTLTLLLRTGMNVNTKSARGETPLLLAITGHHTLSAEMLMGAGADVTLTNNSGSDALGAAVQRRLTGTVNQLLEKGAKILQDDILCVPSYSGEAKIVKALIAAGAKVNVRDSSAKYPVTYAAQNGNVDLLETLAAAEADLNLRDNSGYTPLHYAVMYGRIVMVEKLLELGARTDLKDNDGLTPLQLAKSRDATRIVEILTDSEKIASAAAIPMPASISASASPEMSAGGTEQWVLMGEARLAYIGSWPGLGRKLTEIFNFESRERLTITENLKTGTESVTQPVSFDDIGDAAVAKALVAFRQLGGIADNDNLASKKRVQRPGA